MMHSRILKGVSLCAIVRDEMINPAGGIEDFVRSTLPYVESAVIVDTGSKDGTLGKLFELQQEYPHLEVFRKQFTDYASMRNFALTKVKTPLALVLDADERLFEKDFQRLARSIESLMEQKDKVGLGFVFWHIYSSTADDRHGNGGHNPRLFKVLPDVYFKNIREGHNEILYLMGDDFSCSFSNRCIETAIELKHFLPSIEARKVKVKDWYLGQVEKEKAGETAPSETEGFLAWKALNPRRQLFA